MKRSILGGFFLTLCASITWAQTTPREFSWGELQKAGRLAGGEVQPGGAGGPQEVLKISHTFDWAKSVSVLEIDHPGVTSLHYAIEGRVRYENMQGTGYLEMWSHFPNGGMYFSRGLGDTGPMQSLQGTSDWRPFVLPFFSDAKTGSPSRLVFNVVFGGRGTVLLGPLKLVQYGGGWWSEETAGWIGGFGGGIAGILGALIGVLGGLGRARRFVLILTATLAVLGAAILVAGIVAWSVGQPYEVYYPLLLGGIIMAGVCGVNFPLLRWKYQQIELRKMSALDAGSCSDSF